MSGGGEIIRLHDGIGFTGLLEYEHKLALT